MGAVRLRQSRDSNGCKSHTRQLKAKQPTYNDATGSGSFCSLRLQALDNYTAARLRNKHKVRRRAVGVYPPSYLYEALDIIHLAHLGFDVPWVKA
jgi:hypothetical protein